MCGTRNAHDRDPHNSVGVQFKRETAFEMESELLEFVCERLIILCISVIAD